MAHHRQLALAPAHQPLHKAMQAGGGGRVRRGRRRQEVDGRVGGWAVAVGGQCGWAAAVSGGLCGGQQQE